MQNKEEKTHGFCGLFVCDFLTQISKGFPRLVSLALLGSLSTYHPTYIYMPTNHYLSACLSIHLPTLLLKIWAFGLAQGNSHKGAKDTDTNKTITEISHY